jgi:4-carboxymuconolactone decarboxylase
MAMTTRDELRAQAGAMRARLFGAHAPAAAHVPAELADLLGEVIHGGVWSRPGLALADRMLATLAALAANVRLAALQRHVGPALDLGLAPVAIQEICLQSLLYSGFVHVPDVFAVLGEVFAARGVTPPPAPRDDAGLEELTARGTATMNALHGARAQQGYADPANEITGAMYPAAIRYGYGALWSRPGLDMRQRALVSVAAFTSLRMAEQVRKFGQSAVNAGATRTEIVEAIIQTAPYSGFPPALNALAAMAEVFKA